MIYTFIPKAIDKDISKGYNACMELVPKNDWACLVDHDIMFTTYEWYEQMEAIIKKYPECSCFVAVTNRIGGYKQRVMKNSEDNIKFHRQLGEKLQKTEYLTIDDFSQPEPHTFGGFLILLKKELWDRIKFRKWYKDNGMLGIDSRFHHDLYEAGEKIYIMKGVYIYHWYRGGTGDMSHLK